MFGQHVVKHQVESVIYIHHNVIVLGALERWSIYWICLLLIIGVSVNDFCLLFLRASLNISWQSMLHDFMHHILDICCKSMIIAPTYHDISRSGLLCFANILAMVGIIDFSGLYHSFIAALLNFTALKFSLHLCEVLRFLTFTIFSTC